MVNDYVQESMLIVELRSSVEDIVEKRYRALVGKLSDSAKAWATRAYKQLKDEIRKDTLKEIGIKKRSKSYPWLLLKF